MCRFLHSALLLVDNKGIRIVNDKLFLEFNN